MLCAIYKSLKKENTYLYISKKDDFSSVPEALLTTFCKPQFVMVLNLAGRKLAIADVENVKTALVEQGFYLQVPPLVPNLLEEYKAAKASVKP